jgi:hypothetical protein
MESGTTPSFPLRGRHARYHRNKFPESPTKQLTPFIEHARKAGPGQRRRPGRTASNRDRNGGIRAWAKGQGIAVSARGRIPASIVEQYEAATKGS